MEQNMQDVEFDVVDNQQAVAIEEAIQDDLSWDAYYIYKAEQS